MNALSTWQPALPSTEKSSFAIELYCRRSIHWFHCTAIELNFSYWSLPTTIDFFTFNLIIAYGGLLNEKRWLMDSVGSAARLSDIVTVHCSAPQKKVILCLIHSVNSHSVQPSGRPVAWEVPSLCLPSVNASTVEVPHNWKVSEWQQWAESIIFKLDQCDDKHIIGASWFGSLTLCCPFSIISLGEGEREGREKESTKVKWAVVS